MTLRRLRIDSSDSDVRRIKSPADDAGISACAERFSIGDNNEKIEGCSIVEVESDLQTDATAALVLTGSLTVHFDERVLLLAVDRAYEGVGDGVGWGSLFIYFLSTFNSGSVQSFESE